MHSNSYSLDARVVVLFRAQTEPLEGPFTVGLLTTAPTPEGTHATELTGEGYARAEIDFGPPAGDKLGGTRRSGRRVSFGPIGDIAAKARFAAIFKGDQIIAYGLPQTASGIVEPKEIAFDPGAVRIRF